MITAVQKCGCPSKFSVPPLFSSAGPSSAECCPPPQTSSTLSTSFPPCTSDSSYSSSFRSRRSTANSECPPRSSSRSKPRVRQPFENPRQLSNVSKEDEARCPCPRSDDPKYDFMQGKCSPCCAGVFPNSKIVSQIVAGGKPYKELEAVINDNRMVLRIQRESIEEEWDPPCDCLEGGDPRRGGRLGGGGCEDGAPKQCGNNVVFQKVGDCSSERKTAEGFDACRTVTVFPQPEIVANEPVREEDNEKKDSKKEKNEKFGTQRLEDIEDNPNIFLLRIRKRSENPERKNNIELEFRTPRPWMNRPKPILKSLPPAPDIPLKSKKDKIKIDKGKKGKKGKK